MKNIIKKSLQGLLLVPVFALGVSFVAPVLQPVDTYAAYTARDGAGIAQTDEMPTTIEGEGGVFQTITNVMLFIIGAISVIMLILGGIKYVVSGGDSSAVTSAKNTILYAVVGIIVALLAYALVNFVLTSFSAA
ncbi:MAG: hypothetical protein Q7T74_03170 [Candidatus Saccharibacteria bacterium]|nr:hypothetical protein [Candidatus Saccharibacteria bacterium]